MWRTWLRTPAVAFILAVGIRVPIMNASLAIASPIPVQFHKREVSIRDLAKAAGVTTTTVSLALKNHPRISLMTRTRVHETAKAMGYAPDPTLSKLMCHLKNKKTRTDFETVAWVEHETNPFRKSFAAGIYDGARRRAEALGYKLELFRLDKENTASRVSEILYARSIAGMLLSPNFCDLNSVNMEYKRFATVTAGFRSMNPGLHAVVPDEFDNASCCIQRLHALGYKRIGFYASTCCGARDTQRWLGAILGITRNSGSPLPVLLTPGSADVEEEVTAWLRKHELDALITPHPHVYDWLQKKEGNVGFVLTGVNSASESSAFSGIDERSDLIGATAMDLLASQLLRNDSGIPEAPKIINVPGAWSGDFTVTSQTECIRIPRETFQSARN